MLSGERQQSGPVPLQPYLLTVLLLATSLTVLAGAVLTPVAAVIRDDLALSTTQVGLVLTLHAVSFVSRVVRGTSSTGSGPLRVIAVSSSAT